MLRWYAVFSCHHTRLLIFQGFGSLGQLSCHWSGPDLPFWQGTALPTGSQVWRGVHCPSQVSLTTYSTAIKPMSQADVCFSSNVIAYSIMQHAPQPYRFRSSTLRFQIPSPSSLLPDTRFFRIVRESRTWRILAATAFSTRTWARRTIWGDRVCFPPNLFVHP